MIFRRSGKELFWLGILAVTTGLIALCVYGAFAHGHNHFWMYVVVGSLVGAPLIAVCLYRLAGAEQERHIIEQKREQMMHVENTIYINSAGSVQQTVTAAQEAIRIGLETAVTALKEEILVLERELDLLKKKAKASDLVHKGEKEALERECDTLRKERVKFSNLYDDLAAMYVAENRKYREKCAEGVETRAELGALRRAEQKRLAVERRLLARVRKVRGRLRMRKIENARTSLAEAAAVDRAMEPEPFEVSNAIIALQEYMSYYHSGKRLKTYLWNCFTIDRLKREIRDGVVEMAFGGEWEDRLLAGMIGLGIVELADLGSLKIRSN
ncbi:MAG: hypothetical protein LBT97_12315 [Planctomycetota bacterium]|jgi:hypothetical protein|nr:hypothetical protein [Planctomycetota bacterium]